MSPNPKNGTVGLQLVCITSTKSASDLSSRTSFGQPSNPGWAGSKAVIRPTPGMPLATYDDT